jgi:hypothetical protein
VPVAAGTRPSQERRGAPDTAAVVRLMVRLINVGLPLMPLMVANRSLSG